MRDQATEAGETVEAKDRQIVLFRDLLDLRDAELGNDLLRPVQVAMNLDAEVSRADGPAASGPGLAIGPAVCLLRFSVALEARPDFNAWLGREHFGEAVNIEGLRSFRRYLAVEGEPENLLLYEFDSEEALLAGSVERTWTTPWAKKISPSVAHDENSRVLYRRIWSQG